MIKDGTYLQPAASGIVTAMWNKLTHNAEQLHEINVETKKMESPLQSKKQEYPNNLREEKKHHFYSNSYVSYENGKAKLLIVNLSEE